MLSLVTSRVAVVSAVVLCLSACEGSDTPSLPISVAFAGPPPQAVNANSAVPLTATVFNDGSLAGVNWSVTCATAPCGTFSPASTASGIQTTYTAPASVTAPETVTLTATSISDSSKKVSTTVTVNPPAAASLADGTYIYHYSGHNDDGSFFVTGAFTVDDGAITGGEQDYSSASGSVATNSLIPATSSLSVQGNNIQIVLDTGNDDIGDDGVETLRGAVVSAKRVLISHFDDSAAGTGSVDAQDDDDAKEQPDGSYAFVISGQDSSASPLSLGGVLNFDDGDLSTADSVFDISQLGTPAQQDQTFTAGSVTAPDQFGRVTFTLQPSTASNVPAMVLTGYIIDDDHIQLIESQTDNLGADMGGSALAQGDSAGAFDSDDLAETTYVHASFGTDSNGSVAMAGVFTFNDDNTLSGKLAVNDGTVHQSTPITAGTYTLDPSGRVTLTGVNGAFNFKLYLDGSGNGLIMSLDAQENTAGSAFQQVAPSAEIPEGKYAIVARGVISATDAPTWGAVGQVTLDDDDLDGSTDYTVQGDGPKSAVPLSGSVDSQTSLLSLTGLNSQDSDDSEDYEYYPIDENRTLAIEVSGQQVGLVWLEATQSSDDGDDDDDDDDDDD